MGKQEYTENLGGITSNVTIDVNIIKIPWMARIFGKKIFSEDESENYKCETETIIYKGIVYTTSQTTIRKEQKIIQRIQSRTIKRECDE